VWENLIRAPRQYENVTIANGKIDWLYSRHERPRPQPKYPLLAQRNRYYGSIHAHVTSAVTMSADVMTEVAVIPIQKNSVQTVLDSLARPTKDRLKHCWSVNALFTRAL